jgi:predicted AAA+ superfamily ATPase
MAIMLEGDEALDALDRDLSKISFETDHQEAAKWCASNPRNGSLEYGFMRDSKYISRVLDEELLGLLKAVPALALEGPKGVGKTESAARLAATIRRLDVPAELSVVAADPNLALEGRRPVLIDEWQRFTPVWDAVKRAVDDGAGPGSFLLTGSATPGDSATHSGAGRIVTLRMRPLSFFERQRQTPTVSLGALLGGGRHLIGGTSSISLREYGEEIVRSGFPGLRTLSGRPLRTQLEGYLTRIVDADLVEMGMRVRRPELVRRWLRAYAAATSTTTSYETIRDAATGGEGTKPSKRTTMPYRDILERLWIVDPVPAWIPSRNPISRLSHPPKHHLADPALAARLLGATTETLLSGEKAEEPGKGPLVGALFESLAALSVRVYAQAAEARVGHLRTFGGEREIDLIIERADGRVLAIEVKLGGTVDDTDVKHLLWLKRELEDDLIDMAVLTTGPQAYRRPDGVAVIPLALLGP